MKSGQFVIIVIGLIMIMFSTNTQGTNPILLFSGLCVTIVGVFIYLRNRKKG